MPKVSVIIPAYNCERFISETVDSILSQTYKDYEIIIVDDGSTDRTAEILRQYDGKIKYIYQKNGGSSKARNMGLAAAKGEYIAFLDHDDVWLPDKLEMQVGILEKRKSVGLVYTDMYLANEQLSTTLNAQNKYYFQLAPPYRGKVLNNLFLQNFIATSSVMVRKECFEKIGTFDSLLHGAEDYDRWLRVAAHYEIDYIDKPLVKYRMCKGTLAGDSVSVTEKTLKALKKLSKDYKLPSNLVTRRISLLRFHLVRAYALRGLSAIKKSWNR